MTNTIFILAAAGLIVFIGITIAFFWGMKRLEVNALARKKAEEERKREQKLQGRSDKTV